MPFALLFFGLLLVVAGVRNTHVDNGSNEGLFTLLKNDFLGQGSFTYWVVAIVAIGSLGYVEPLKTPSRYMLALIIVVLILAQEKSSAGGFFAQLQKGLSQITTGTTPVDNSTASVTQAPSNVLPFKTPAISTKVLSVPYKTIGDLENALNGASP